MRFDIALTICCCCCFLFALFCFCRCFCFCRKKNKQTRHSVRASHVGRGCSTSDVNGSRFARRFVHDEYIIFIFWWALDSFHFFCAVAILYWRRQRSNIVDKSPLLCFENWSHITHARALNFKHELKSFVFVSTNCIDFHCKIHSVRGNCA